VRRIPPAQRREALVAAAIRVIAAQGMAGATTRAVAAEAGMSLASLHYVFGSRDALLEAVIEQVVEAEATAAADVLAVFDAHGTPLSLDALLASGIDHFVDGLVASPDDELALAELTIHARRAGMTELLDQQRRIYLDAAGRTLARAAHQAGAEWTVPLADVTMLLTTLLDGITYSWLAHRDEASARTSGRFSARSLAALAVPKPTAEPRSTAEPRFAAESITTEGAGTC
jgi:TetR/AcrR family transcriptional regulator, regulator of biofilm formation and stress response